MSQNTQNNITNSSNTTGLKPVLAVALASLEVQLDQELTRYRRIRNNGKKHSLHSSVRISGFTEYNPTTLNQTDHQTTIPEKTGHITQSRISLPSIPTNSSSTNSISPNILPIPTENSIIKHEPVKIPENPSSQETTKPETTTDKLASSIVPTKSSNTDKEEITSSTDTVKQPDDYLESSEALLRSLNDEPNAETQSNESHTYKESVLSPIGIGSMFLLLLASLILGYVLINPKYLPKFNFNLSSLSNNNSNPLLSPSMPASEPPKPPEITTPDNKTTSTTQAEITPIPKYPNLANQEFAQVRDPNDVVGLKPKAKPTPAIPQITPTTLTIQPPVTPVATLPTLSPIPNVPNVTEATSNPVSEVSPSPSISPSSQPQGKITVAPIAEDIKPSANGYYYIIADNNGADKLEAAKKVVADAYLSPNRKFIYLGALKNKEDVKRRLQELADQGIAGRVQQ